MGRHTERDEARCDGRHRADEDAKRPAASFWSPEGGSTLIPVEAATPLDGLEAFESTELAALSRFIVPFGGLVRGRLAPGETLVVNGATGAFGTAAVLLGVAMGAARVVAAGRNAAVLSEVAKAAGGRVATVALSGDVAADAAAIREARERRAESSAVVAAAFPAVARAVEHAPPAARPEAAAEVAKAG